MKSQLKLIIIAACAFASCATPQKKRVEDLPGFYRLETSDVEGLVSLDLDLKNDFTYTMKFGILPDRGATVQREEIGLWKANKGLITLGPKTSERSSNQAVPRILLLKAVGDGEYLVGTDDAHHILKRIQIVQKLRIDDGAMKKEPNQTPEPTAAAGRGSS